MRDDEYYVYTPLAPLTRGELNALPGKGKGWAYLMLLDPLFHLG
jgi:hypothetical protein